MSKPLMVETMTRDELQAEVERLRNAISAAQREHQADMKLVLEAGDSLEASAKTIIDVEDSVRRRIEAAEAERDAAALRLSEAENERDRLVNCLSSLGPRVEPGTMRSIDEIVDAAFRKSIADGAYAVGIRDLLERAKALYIRTEYQGLDGRPSLFGHDWTIEQGEFMDDCEDLARDIETALKDVTPKMDRTGGHHKHCAVNWGDRCNCDRGPRMTTEASWTTTGKNCPIGGVCQDSECWKLGEKPCKRWNAGERRPSAPVQIGPGIFVAPSEVARHPEDSCQECGRPNVVWFAPNEIWNATDTGHDILCPVCFIKRAEAAGFNKSAWRIAPEFSDAPPVAGIAEMEARKDAAYEERNRVVSTLAWMALWAGWKAGIARTAIEGWSEDWHGCVYIDFPNGQASWHYHDSHAPLFAGLPSYAGSWDGHTTPEKYERLAHVCKVLGASGPVGLGLDPHPDTYAVALHVDGTSTNLKAYEFALRFHEVYERLAPSFGYETRPETREFDPESKNGRLMIAVCDELLTTKEKT
jgi:hypothetical protein